MSSRTLRKRAQPVVVKEESDDEPEIKKPKGRSKKSTTTDNGEVAQKGRSTAKKGKATTSKKAKVDNADIKIKTEDDDADASDTLAVTTDKTGGKSKTKGKAKKSQVKKSGKENTDLNNVKSEPLVEKTGVARSVVKKGKAPVDGSCPVASVSHVFWENDDLGILRIWDCMLNQTNIQFNNNKFYLIQLLKNDAKEDYSVWMRWGRVGANGQTSLQPCGTSLEQAKRLFCKKFSDKTKNDWDMIDCFEKVPGKYDLLKMDYSQNEDEVDTKPIVDDKPHKKVESELQPTVKSLIELICDIKVMEDAVTEMKYDAKKAPLGKLTTDQITAGYSALKKIDELIIEGKVSNRDLVDACNAFYTRVPHYFGMKVPPLIRTQAEVRQKLKLLEALGDIQAALTLIGQPIDIDVHPTDQRYKQLACNIKVLESDSPTFALLNQYLQSTHGKTHRNYKMKLLDVFECVKDTEATRFNDIGNRKLLWHGSRLSNWAGILGQGLRIAPPEAPVTGYMFGKGVYFADMSSKSANYCCVSRKNNIGLLTLCEVALGTSNELLNAKYDAHKLPKGCHSVKGLGETVPNPKNSKFLEDGTEVPMGPGIDSKIKNRSGYTLQYNEYIVYNVNQIRMRYLLKVQFDH